MQQVETLKSIHHRHLVRRTPRQLGGCVQHRRLHGSHWVVLSASMSKEYNVGSLL